MRRIVFSLISLLLPLSAMASDKMSYYDVTITNGSSSQVLTPPVVATHKAKASVFSVGQPASAELAHLAENGDGVPLVSKLQTMQGVYQATQGDAPGVLLPGHSVTIRVMAGKRARVSVVSMLASTNDGFIGLNGARLHGNMSSKMVGVYDAGSEANTEMCAHIPGPPCAMDSGNARMENGAEGFVSFHSGIRGNVDIPAGMDWRGDLALISIKKVSD